MCKECADRSGDKRMQAFVPHYSINILRQRDANRARVGGIAHAEIHVFTDVDVANSAVEEFENDPTIVAMQFNKSAICLN